MNIEFQDDEAIIKVHVDHKAATRLAAELLAEAGVTKRPETTAGEVRLRRKILAMVADKQKLTAAAVIEAATLQRAAAIAIYTPSELTVGDPANN